MIDATMIDTTTNAMSDAMTKPLALFCTAVLFGFAATPAGAQDAGSVIFVRGDVSAERQPPEVLAKGDAIRSSDIVVTGAAARAQLLMIDGAKIALRPDSRLAIVEYSQTPAPAAGAAVRANNDSAVMELVKGGFRTITGAIGTQDDTAYEVRTAVGVLGIRGTDYSAVFCNGDCTWVPGANAAAAVADGLYLGVTAGVIEFRTSTQTIELAAGEYAFIPLDTPEPQRLDAPPAVLLDDNDLRFDAGNGPSAKPRAGDGGRTGFNAVLGTRRVPAASAVQATGDSDQDPDDSDSSQAPKQPTLATDPDGALIDITPGTPAEPRGNRTISFSTGPLGGGASVWVGSANNTPAQFRLAQDNNLEYFRGNYPAAAGPDVADFGIGTASNLDTGFDSMTVMRWGRWSGGAADVTPSGRSTVPQDLGSQSIHWVSGPEAGAPAMPISGIANYRLVGSTSPTDNLGNVGVLGAATFDANFTNQSVDSTLQIDINGSNWIASGVGNIGTAAGLPANLFDGIYGAVVINGQSTGSGIFSGFFSRPGATSDPAFPGAVGLTFSLQNMPGTTVVSGAVVFGNP